MIRTTRLEALALAAGDLLLVAAAFALAWWLRFGLGLAELTPDEPPPARYVEALPPVLAVFLLVLRARRLHDRLDARGYDVVEGTWRAATFASLVVLGATFFYRDFSYSRAVCVLGWAGACALLPVPRLLVLAGRRRRWARGEGLVPALVVGTWPAARDLVDRLGRHERYGLGLVGVLTSGPPPPEGARAGPPPWRGDVAALEATAAAVRAREVLVSDTLARLELLELLERCERLGLEVRVVPALYDLFVVPDDLTELHGVPFVAVREHRVELGSRIVKRALDLVVGAALLLVAAPLIGALALLVRWTSPGAPAFFSQIRVGEGGRRFRMWKLRTMVPDAAARLRELVDLDGLAAPVFKLEDDPRVTPVGRALRRWSLDELPQLWNVVRGDMSLVGPRPEEEAVVARYDAHHRRRLKAKPGLTGLQQVVARASTDMDERVRLDVLYIRRRTLLFDLWLLLRTPWAVLHGRGAR